LMESLKRKRRKRRKMINERTIILLLFLILLGVGLAGCNKLQEKKSITQTWKWGKKKCNDG
jgi:hypothetical protein